MASIAIRKLEPSVLQRIDELAKRHDMKREPYIRAVLERLAVSGELNELDNKYNSLVLALEDERKMMLDIIDKNTFIIKKIEEKL